MTFKLEISKSFLSFLEHLRVVDSDQGSVENTIWISANLRLVLEVVAKKVLDGKAQRSRSGSERLGEVVDEESVLVGGGKRFVHFWMNFWLGVCKFLFFINYNTGRLLRLK
jgi:hypothetical protein